MGKLVAGLLLTMVVLAGCARPYAPPGGERDRLPPALVSTSPAPLAVGGELDAPVVFRFDERIRTRTFTRALVSVSPSLPDEIEFDIKGSEVRVRRRGGWQPGQIYHVILRPGVEDLFGNRRSLPAELVFSTGPQIPPTALAGLVEDRITARAARDAVVEAVRRNDSTVYRTYADSAAFFALRHVPYGTYDVVAYSDANRNARRDASEARHLGVTASLGPGQDTVQVFFNLLPSDTTGPRLLRAETQDSLSVRLTFDDAIDPDSGMVGGGAELFALPDSSSVPAALDMQLQAVAAAAARIRQAAVDSARADSARADTAAARVPVPPPAAAQDTARILPEKVLVLTMERALSPGEYAVVVRGLRNVNGLVGGGSARFTVRPPPRRPAADTARAEPADSLPTAPVRPDSVNAPVRADTIPARRPATRR